MKRIAFFFSAFHVNISNLTGQENDQFLSKTVVTSNFGMFLRIDNKGSIIIFQILALYDQYSSDLGF